jgi:hypothetical protein
MSLFSLNQHPTRVRRRLIVSTVIGIEYGCRLTNEANSRLIQWKGFHPRANVASVITACVVRIMFIRVWVVKTEAFVVRVLDNH